MTLGPVHGVTALGAGLYRSPELAPDVYAGVDVLVIPPNESFPKHTHPGHHVLFVLEGPGTVWFNGETFETHPGDLVVIPADVEHNVAAGDYGQMLLAFGAPHKHIDAPDRMAVT